MTVNAPAKDHPGTYYSLDAIILGDSFWEIYPVDHQASLAIPFLPLPADCRPVWLWQPFVSSQPCGIQPAVTLGAMGKQ